MTARSVISFASTLSSSQPEFSLGIFENRKLKVGEAYFSEGNFEQAVYYFKRFLDSVEKSYPQNDDRTIMAHEKLADAEAMCSQKKASVNNYRIAITEIREKLSDGLIDADYENVLNKRFSRVLVNCGNVFLGLTKDSKEQVNYKQVRFGDYCENAIECYEEAMPLLQEQYGLSSPPLMELAQRFSTARENLAKHFIEKEKTHLAAEQYQETILMLTPYMNALDRESKDGNKNQPNKYYTLILFYYFKHAINLGLIHLQDGRLDAVMEVFGGALRQIKLREDTFDKDDLAKLDALPPQVSRMVCTLLHNMGVVCQRKKRPERTEAARVQFTRVIHLKDKLGANSGFSILGLGECHFELMDYDKALQNLLKAEEILEFNNLSTYNEAIDICFSNISTIYRSRNDIENCITYLKKKIQYLKRSLTDDLESGLKKISHAMQKIACIYFEVKKFDDALNTHEETLTYQRQKGDSPSNFSTTLQHIGQIYVVKKMYEMAFDSYVKSLQFSSNTEKIVIYFEMGSVLCKMKFDCEAIDHYKSCKKLALEAAMFNISIIVKCARELGLLYAKFDEYNKALSEYEDTLILLDDFGITHGRDRSAITLGLGNTHLYLGDLDLAMRYCVEAKENLPKGQPSACFEDLKNCVFSISDVHEEKNEIDQSLSCLRELMNDALISIIDEYKNEIEGVVILYKIACVQFRDGKYAEAINTHENILCSKIKAHKLVTSDDVNFNEDISITFRDIGDVNMKIQMYDQAVINFERALVGVSSASKAVVLCKIGRVKVAMKSQNEALDSFQKALSLLKGQFPKHRKTSILVLRHIASFDAKMFRNDEAIEQYEKALLLQNINYDEETGEVTRCLQKSKYMLISNDEAIQSFQVNKNRVNIDDLCTTYDEVKTVMEEIVKEYACDNDLDSCITCLKSTINFARLFISDKISLKIEVAKSLSRIACVQQQAGKYGDALNSHEVSLCFKKMMSSDDNPDISLTYHSIGEVYVAKGEYQYALNNLREALKGAFEEDKIVILDKMGMVLHKMGHVDGAKDCYESALLLCENRHIEQRILLLNNLGNINICTGNLNDALSCYTQALTSVITNQYINEETKHILLNMGYLSERVADDEKKTFFDSNIAFVLNYFGIVHLNERKFEEAIEWLQHSVDLLKSLPQHNIQLLSVALSNIGFAYCHLPDYDKALENLSEAIEITEGMTIKNERLLASLYVKSGLIHFKKRNYDSSLDEYQQALTLMGEIGNEKEKIEMMHNIALVHCKKRQYDDALKLLKKVREQTVKIHGNDHLEVAKVLIDLGNLSRKQRDFDMASKQFFRASEILIKSKCPRDHPYHVENHKAINKLGKNSKSLISQ